jgi:curli biogenesis system outer membrane secretion channel CsgG
MQSSARRHAVSRRGFARRIVMASGALAAASLVAPLSLFGMRHEPEGKPTVAVMYFNNGALSQHDDYEPLRKGIADVLITELAANDSIRVVERDQLQKLLEEQDLATSGRVDEATAVKVGKLLGAQHMIFGGFVIDMKGRMRLDARAVNVETSEIEYVSTVSDKADDVLALIAKLAAQLNDGMKLPGPRGAAAAASSSSKSNPAALKSLILYARAVGAQDARDNKQAATLYQKFLDSSPSTILVAQRTMAQDKLRELQEAGS